MGTDRIMEEDIDLIIRHTDWEPLVGAKVMVTGATGLIGSLMVKAMAKANVEKDLGMRVFALVRNTEKAREVFAGYKTVEFIVQDVRDEISYHGPVDYLIHCASMTKSKDFVDHPVDVINTILDGTENILKYAIVAGLKGMVFLSTMEVYGHPSEDSGKIKENDYAYLDNLAVRSSYPESKKMAETMCVAYNKQFDVPVKIARLTQTFGAGVKYNDPRVFAEFARCAIEGRDIVLHTDGSTFRNYCYVADAAGAVLAILMHGKNAEAYNVANPDTGISIKDMAELVANISEHDIKVKIEAEEDIDQFGYAPKLTMDLDTTKLEALSWKPEFGLEDMFRRTIESMKLRS